MRTEPPLRNCWAVNVSPSGAGLTATRLSGEPLPAAGQRLVLELTLPDSGTPLRLGGEVRWACDAAGPVDGEESIAIGVQFGALDGDAALGLRRYFHAFRPHAAVVHADLDEQERLAALLGERVHLHRCQSDAELLEVVRRGDIGAVIVAGASVEAAEASVRALAGLDEEVWAMTPAADLAPRVVYAAASAPSFLAEAFNQGWIFRAVARPWLEPALEAAVQRALAEHGVRTEQRRAAMALEQRLSRELAATRSVARLEQLAERRLIFESRAMAEVLRAVRQVAPHRVGVLLEGETGTGKELVARLVHELSDRANAAFVAQDCAALSETLLESELFGHVRGAFTGAIAAHPGLFVLADGGTILLDEVENTSPALQAKLLRVIEAGEVRPVGGTRTRHVDVRVIAASNRDLRAEVEAGRFRADLYFRLATFPLTIPPLRDRPEDILPLARHFLAAGAARYHKAAPMLGDAAARRLLAYAWPGNVRELRNAIERALLLADRASALEVDLLPDAVRGEGPRRTRAGVGLRAQLDGFEREVIRAALTRHGGVVRRAAAELGVNAVTLGRRARRLGLIDAG